MQKHKVILGPASNALHMRLAGKNCSIIVGTNSYGISHLLFLFRYM